MRRPTTILIPTVLASLALTACGSSSSSTHSSASPSTPAAASASAPSAAQQATVKRARNATLGATILVDSHGMTLYHLSGEQAGKFICASSSCTSIWHPLTASGSGAPTGAESLGTTKRPDGSEQVTYKGEPLYTFVQAASEGDAKGQGVKDVGTWSAVRTGSSSPAAPASTSTTTTKSTGGAYGY